MLTKDIEKVKKNIFETWNKTKTLDMAKKPIQEVKKEDRNGNLKIMFVFLLVQKLAQLIYDIEHTMLMGCCISREKFFLKIVNS